MMKERKHAKMMGMMKRINKNDEKWYLEIMEDKQEMMKMMKGMMEKAK
jgi:hypothetical protein